MAETGADICKTAEQLAEEINGIKVRTAGILDAAFGVARQSCFEIGKRLEAAKALVPHGEWGEWLRTNVAYSETTANNLMRIWREYGSEQVDLFTGRSDAELFGGLGQSQLVELFALPKGERAAFIEAHEADGTSMSDISVRTLREEIDKWKQQAASLQEQLDEAAEWQAQSDRDDEENRTRIGELEQQLETVRAERDKAEDAARAGQAEQVQAMLEQEREKLRGEAEDAVRDRYIKSMETAEAAWKQELEQLTAERDGQLEEAKSKLEDLQATHRAEAEKAAAELAAVRDEVRQAQLAARRSGDPHTVRVVVHLSTLQRTVGEIAAELEAMERETPGSGRAMQHRVEATIGRLLDAQGWQV